MSVKRRPPPVIVVWEDAHCDGEWGPLDAPLEPRIQSSIGFLLANDAKQIVICQTHDVAVSMGGDKLRIPKAMVREIVKLRRMPA